MLGKLNSKKEKIMNQQKRVQRSFSAEFKAQMVKPD
jgi:transposase-like protein